MAHTLKHTRGLPSPYMNSQLSEMGCTEAHPTVYATHQSRRTRPLREPGWHPRAPRAPRTERAKGPANNSIFLLYLFGSFKTA